MFLCGRIRENSGRRHRTQLNSHESSYCAVKAQFSGTTDFQSVDIRLPPTDWKSVVQIQFNPNFKG